MGFFDNWTITETPTKPKEPQTWEDVVNRTIDDQRKIANGEKLRGTKKTQGTNEYPLRPSWYKQDRNVIIPTIGIFPILGSQKSIECTSNDEYKKFLDMFQQNWNTDPQLKKMMDEVKTKYEKRSKIK